MKKILFSALVLPLFALLPQFASATTVVLTSGSSWQVPSDWNSSNNTVEVIGGGGGGGNNAGGGGGGGGYAKIVNVNLTPKAQLTYSIGGGGGASASGGDTYFNGTSCGGSSVCAKGGAGAPSVPFNSGAYSTGTRTGGGAGGSAAGSIGTVVYAGGSGGAGYYSQYRQCSGHRCSSRYYKQGGGGGGAAGPHGNGGSGGAAYQGDVSIGGGGGGGGGGTNGSNAALYTFAPGGNNWLGYGGASGTGGSGTDGGGGSGGGGNGGNGGAGIDWGSGYGSGGGAGGANHTSPYNGGSGGAYGGGGGGGAGVRYSQGYGGSGAPGIIVITYTPGPATCKVWFAQNPIPYGGGTTMYWTSSNAYQMFINNYKYVTPNTSGSVYLSGRTATTDFSCYAWGSSGDSGWQSAVLTVDPPVSCSLPWGGSISNGQSVTAYRSSIASPCASETRTCANGTLSGSYQYQSCAPATCTLDGVTVASGQSHTFYSTTAAPTGQRCSSYGQSRTCESGSFTGSSSYDHASCSCTPETTYSCSGGNIVQSTTNASCVVYSNTSYATCTAPAFCSAGSSSCLYPPPSFVSFTTTGTNSFTATGHLQAVPSVVPKGNPVSLYWDINNVSSCTIQGSNGDTWSGASAGCNGSSCVTGTGGIQSTALTQQTIFTMDCTALDKSTIPQESVTADIIPVFHEY